MNGCAVGQRRHRHDPNRAQRPPPVYLQQAHSPVPVPDEVTGYLRFANGIIGAVMAGWMLTVIALARGPFLAGERYAWNAIAWPLLA